MRDWSSAVCSSDLLRSLPRNSWCRMRGRRADAMSEARHRVVIATRPFVHRMRANHRPDATRLVHHALVGGGIDIVLVESKQVELFGRLGLRRHFRGKAGMALLLQAAFILVRSEEHTSELQSLML